MFPLREMTFHFQSKISLPCTLYSNNSVQKKKKSAFILIKTQQFCCNSLLSYFPVFCQMVWDPHTGDSSYANFGSSFNRMLMIIIHVSSAAVYGLPLLGLSSILHKPSWKWDAHHGTVLWSTSQTSCKAIWMSFGFFPHVQVCFWYINAGYYTITDLNNFYPPFYSITLQTRTKTGSTQVHIIIRQRMTYNWHNLELMNHCAAHVCAVCSSFEMPSKHAYQLLDTAVSLQMMQVLQHQFLNSLG